MTHNRMILVLTCLTVALSGGSASARGFGGGGARGGGGFRGGGLGEGRRGRFEARRRAKAARWRSRGPQRRSETQNASTVHLERLRRV